MPQQHVVIVAAGCQQVAIGRAKDDRGRSAVMADQLSSHGAGRDVENADRLILPDFGVERYCRVEAQPRASHPGDLRVLGALVGQRRLDFERPDLCVACRANQELFAARQKQRSL